MIRSFNYFVFLQRFYPLYPEAVSKNILQNPPSAFYHMPDGKKKPGDRSVVNRKGHSGAKFSALLAHAEDVTNQLMHSPRKSITKPSQMQTSRRSMQRVLHKPGFTIIPNDIFEKFGNNFARVAGVVWRRGVLVEDVINIEIIFFDQKCFVWQIWRKELGAFLFVHILCATLWINELQRHSVTAI